MHFQSNQKSVLKWVIIVIAAILLVAVLSGSVWFAMQYSKLSYDNIYQGVRVGDLSLGKMSIDDAAKKIEETFVIENERFLRLYCGEAETVFSLEEVGAAVDGKKTAENAFALGREGESKVRLDIIKDIKQNGAEVDVVITFDENILTSKIHEIANVVDEPEREIAVSLEGEELVITRGMEGKRILEETARKQICQAILTPDVFEVQLKKEKVIPPELNIEYLEKEVCTPPQDASYTIENQRLTIIDEKIGVEIDSQTVRSIIDETPGDVVRIPVIITKPEITAETINAELFPELLATYSSTYTASNIPRSHNVALASSLVSNSVLAPGDVFSYNDTVGPRTAERGFREAGVYVGNKVEQGLGGGICQVSSTLFNAVVLSDLEIVYRKSHSLPVSYVPAGRDATVSYGSIDFKFANNTDAPIKIVASAVNGRNTVSIYGTKKHPGRTIEIYTERTAEYAPKVKKIEDPELFIGTVEVEEEGAYGSAYTTYKTIRENGTAKTELLTKSTYAAMDRVERIGTKAKEVFAEEIPTLAPTEVPTLAPTEEPMFDISATMAPLDDFFPDGGSAE